MPSDLSLDATAIKVLAHPLRSRLLVALRTEGPATATDLAARLGSNSGATSYHLRKLASVALVEDAEGGVGRQRIWRATTHSHSWHHDDFAGDEDAQAAATWLAHSYLRLFAERYAAWLDAEGDWPAAWTRATGGGDDEVLVTPDQSAQMYAELAEVVARYRTAGEGDPDAIALGVWHYQFPKHPGQPPEPTSDAR